MFMLFVVDQSNFALRLLILSEKYLLHLGVLSNYLIHCRE